jgi:mRNA-degrading endonuclease RelE of RelBE toxin-antitoxin system
MDVKMSEKAVKEFKNLDTPIKQAALDAMRKLSAYPSVSGVKHLEAKWRGYARMRILKDWRMIFRILPTLLIIVRICHRSKAYE